MSDTHKYGNNYSTGITITTENYRTDRNYVSFSNTNPNPISTHNFLGVIDL